QMLQRIHDLDPSNVSAEIDVAYSHSVGWSGDGQYFPLISQAAARHAGDMRALGQIAKSIAEDLSRNISFDHDNVAKYYSSNPESDLLAQIGETLRANNAAIPQFASDTLISMYRHRGDKKNQQEF